MMLCKDMVMNFTENQYIVGARFIAPPRKIDIRGIL